MIPIDGADVVNGVEERLIAVLAGFASQDIDWQSPQIVKGFPAFDTDTPITNPIIALYLYDSRTYETGFDNIVDTNGLYGSDPNSFFSRGIEWRMRLYIDVFTSRGTSEKSSPTGGATLSKRIASKICTNLLLNEECLGEELEITRDPSMHGPFEPEDSKKPNLVFYRVDVGLGVTVSEKFQQGSVY